MYIRARIYNILVLLLKSKTVIFKLLRGHFWIKQNNYELMCDLTNYGTLTACAALRKIFVFGRGGFMCRIRAL